MCFLGLLVSSISSQCCVLTTRLQMSPLTSFLLTRAPWKSRASQLLSGTLYRAQQRVVWMGLTLLCVTMRQSTQPTLHFWYRTWLQLRGKEVLFDPHPAERRHSGRDGSLPHISKQPGEFVDTGVCLKTFNVLNRSDSQHKWKWITKLYLSNNIK